MTTLEHVNFTVTDARATARWMQDVFGWHIRWEGASIYEGFSIHVGSDACYVALYQPPEFKASDSTQSYFRKGGLNHVAVTVDDLSATEARVKAAGFTPHSHADYEPGTRFYFKDDNAIEYEVVSYA